ncbi:MAG TPA: SHOCT domain-containing protein [Gemmataceae bacterium]|nr:SHOCT domain-containing protein [Gemmataceae bacterium]
MSLADELEKLDQLRRSGSLSDDEFARAKAHLLANPPADAPSGDHLADIRHQNELARIDREWEIEREQYLINGRYGRRHVPTVGMGVATAALGGGFGIFWTVMAVSITSGAPDVGAFSTAKVFFPLFGVLFIAIAVGWGVYCVVRAQKYEAANRAYRDRRAVLSGERDAN